MARRHLAHKEDISEPVIPVKAFPTTLRRQLVDVAAKMVSHAGKTVLKVMAVAMGSLGFQRVAGAMPLRFTFRLELNQGAVP